MGAAGVVLVAVLGLLACAEAYKVYAVAVHLLWINANGSLYRQVLLELGDRGSEPTTADVHEALRTIGADRVTALGFKEFRALADAGRWAASPRRAIRLKGRVLRVAVKAFDFTVLGSIGGLALFVAGLAQGGQPDGTLTVVGLVSCLLLQLTIVLICLEATVNYARLSSYGLLHHNPRLAASGRPVNRFLAEAATLVGVSAAAVYIDSAVLVFLANSNLSDFGTPDRWTGAVGVFNAIYETSMTFVLSSPLAPADVIGRLFVLFVTGQGILILVLALTALASASGEPRSS
jgi:hypothetical protein